MNKNLMIGGIVVLILVGGVAVYASQKQAAQNQEKEAMKQQEIAAMEQKAAVSEGAMKKEGAGAMMKKDTAMVGTHGTYEAYSVEKVALASATHRVILFFRAGWCPTCRALDADIKANLGNIPANVTILDVDYDNSTDLKMKYGVRMQHTLVEVTAQGTLIQKWLGSPTLADLVTHVK